MKFPRVHPTCFCAGNKKRRGGGQKMEDEEEVEEALKRFNNLLLATCVEVQAQLSTLQRAITVVNSLQEFEEKKYLFIAILHVAAALKKIPELHFSATPPNFADTKNLLNMFQSYFDEVVNKMGVLREYIESAPSLASAMAIGKVFKVIKDKLSFVEPSPDPLLQIESSSSSTSSSAASDYFEDITDVPSLPSSSPASLSFPIESEYIFEPRGVGEEEGEGEPNWESSFEEEALLSSKSEPKMASQLTKPSLQKYPTSPELAVPREVSGMKKSFSFFGAGSKKTKNDQEIVVYNPLYGKKIDQSVIAKNIQEGKLKKSFRVTSKIFRPSNRLNTTSEWLTPSKADQVIPIFGTPLNLIPLSQNRVPKFLESAIKFLQECTTVDYREMVTMQMPELDLLQFQKAIERGHKLEELPVDEVVVFSLLKSFLSQLPDPLICVSAYDDIIQTEAILPLNKKLSVMKDILLSLPLNHMFSLRLVIKFLHEISPYLPSPSPSAATSPFTTPFTTPLSSPRSSPSPCSSRTNTPSPLLFPPPTKNPENFRASLEISRNSLELSRNSLEISRNSLEVSRNSLEISRNIPNLYITPPSPVIYNYPFVNNPLQTVNSYTKFKSLSNIFAPLLLRKENSSNDQAAKIDVITTMINNYFYLFETHTEELQYEMNSAASAYIVTAASPRMAAQKLVDPFYTEHDFVDAILLTYSYFSTATELLNSIISLYHTDFSRGAEQLQIRYRLKILYVINLWLQRNLLRLRTDDTFCGTLSEFVTSHQVTASPLEKPHFMFVQQWIKKNYTNTALKKEKTKVPAVPSKPLSFLEIPEEKIAHQMIYIDNKLFRGMKFSDFLHKNFERATNSPGFTQMMQRFNTWGAWVATEIVSEKMLLSRAKIISRFIRIAQICLDMQAFNTAYGVIAGLGNSSVERLKNTWGIVDKELLAKYKTIQEVFDMNKNYCNYRKILQSSISPLVPFLGLYPKDLFAIEENLNTKTETKLISMTKLRKLHEIIRPLLDYQLGKNYVIKSDRSVHYYLKNLSVLGENEIHKYSLACEPRASALTIV